MSTNNTKVVPVSKELGDAVSGWDATALPPAAAADADASFAKAAGPPPPQPPAKKPAERGKGGPNSKRLLVRGLLAFLLLAAIGGILGGLAAAGVFDAPVAASSSSPTASSADPFEVPANATAIMALPASITLTGISKAEFDEPGVRLQFREAVASGLPPYANASDVLITDVNEDNAGAAAAQRRSLSARLVVDFVVLTFFPEHTVAHVAADGADGFLQIVVQSLATKTGPLTLASVVVGAFVPPSLDRGTECPAVRAPMARAPPGSSSALAAGAIVRLPISGPGAILTVRVDDANIAPLLGRTYDGRAWEASPGAPLELFTCCTVWCAAQLPQLASGGGYTLQEVPAAHTASTASRASDASMARLLAQATFGPTRVELDALRSAMDARGVAAPDEGLVAREDAVFKDWVKAQIALPSSLHRAYYRRRVNPRFAKGLIMPTGSPRAACDAGTRWQRYVFDDSHRENFIQVVPTGSHLRLLDADSKVLAVVAAADFQLEPALVQTSSPTSFFVCAHQGGLGGPLFEWVGGGIKLSNDTTTGDCNNGSPSLHTARNPAIAFAGGATPPATLQVFEPSEIDLEAVLASWGRVDFENDPDDDLGDDVVVAAPLAGAACKAGGLLDHIQLGAGYGARAGRIYRRDYRMEMVQNTLTSPAESTESRSTMSGTCPSVPPTFVNRKTCVQRPACAPLTYKSAPLTLNRTTLRRMFERSGKLVYTMEGLRLADEHSRSQCKSKILASCDPCGVDDDTRKPFMPRLSRWQRSSAGACVSATSLDTGTAATIARAINATRVSGRDANPHVVDIDLRSVTEGDVNATCVPAAAFGASVVFDGECFTHVHPHLYQVVDATYWDLDHAGNGDSNAPGVAKFRPIRAFAEAGGTSLVFPGSHPMSRWNKDTFKSGTGYRILDLGARLDDVVDFKDLPVETQELSLAKLFGAVADGSHNPTHMACGSPGEVANDPALAHKYGIQLVYGVPGTAGKFYNYADAHNDKTKQTVATMMALTSDDQLRQRVAWALAQIFVISEVDISVKRGQAEIWLAYHDIFVRHGFGRFHDILREVAYAPMMGTMLTFLNSKAFAASGTPADENFAREVMQLFTIGLWKLNMDGSYMLDPDTGDRIPTYTNKNIQSFARVWTGFRLQNFRGNIEGHRGAGSTNFLDPMRLHGQWHDVLPKLALGDEYLGDTVQLCSDIPPFSFLQQGARYLNVGPTLPHEDSPIPGDLDPAKTSYRYGPNVHPQYSPPPPEGFDNPFTSVHKRLVPETTSQLFQALCGNGGTAGAPCTFPAEVELPTSIACHARECRLDKEIIYVKIIDPTDASVHMFYQFAKPLCVQMAFYSDPKSLALNHNGNRRVCANPALPAGGAVCCMTPDQPGGYYGFDRCEYHLEKVTWDKAVSRCAGIIDDCTQSDPPGTLNLGRYWPWLTGTGDQQNPQRVMEVCKKRPGASRRGLRVLDGCGYNYRASWINEACTVKVQVDRFGRLNTVHDPGTEQEVQLDSGNVFHVHWKDDSFPLAADDCGNTGRECAAHGLTCLCNITVVDQPVFSAVDATPTLAEVRRRLKIGSPPINTFASGAYTVCTTPACTAVTGVEIYLKQGSTTWGPETIFKTANPVAFLFNRLSTVHVGGEASSAPYSFRNVPHFISLRESSQTDMEAEIEALLEMLLKHGNTAPFIARRLIQHLVTSNPSPRYIKAVAEAFRDGVYDGIGTREYGDLAATVAAVLLDPEARTPVLDAEPTFGKIREPYLKLIHLLRSLEFRPGAGGHKEVVMKGLGAIGMRPFASPTVFNFYAPDFQPQGVLRAQGLFSPEMMLGTPPNVLGFLNGVSSLIQLGLTDQHGGKGFGPRTGDGGDTPGTSRRDGGGSREANGFLAFTPHAAPTDAAAVVEELNVLLTSGRLDAHSRGVIEAAYKQRLTRPPPIPTAEVRLHSDNIDCKLSHEGRALALRLAQPKGTEIRHGSYGKPVYLSSADRSGIAEVYVPKGVMHFAWGGANMYLHIDKKHPRVNCSMLEAVLRPGDVVLASRSSFADGPTAALQLAQALLLASAEFHTANTNARVPNGARQDPPKVASQGRRYKAIVMVFFAGGMDSWNLIVPHTGCTTTASGGAAFDLHNEYMTLRGDVALSPGAMLPITSPNDRTRNTQPCTGFGVNPAMSRVRQMYLAGDAAFVANAGPLVEPLTRTDYDKKRKMYPASLYAHNVQQTTTKTVHAGVKKKTKGVMGRIVEALTSLQDAPYAAATYSMLGVQPVFDGQFPPSILGGGGVTQLLDELGQTKYIEEMLASRSAHGFSETFSHMLNRSVVDTARLGAILADSPAPTASYPDSGFARQLKNVASVILARANTGNEREMFYTQQGGFDSHFQALAPGSVVYGKLEEVDAALAAFEAEMKAEGIWDDVVLISASDFGRKIVGNSGGSDHAWGGNYFVAGGAVRGGQILGEYPDRLDETHEQNLFNSGGRFIPTTSWEALWKPLAQWFGVASKNIGHVLPNIGNFPADHLFSREDVFEI